MTWEFEGFRQTGCPKKIWWNSVRPVPKGCQFRIKSMEKEN